MMTINNDDDSYNTLYDIYCEVMNFEQIFF